MLSRGQSLGHQMDRDTTKFGDRRENGQPSQHRDDRGSTLPTTPHRAEVIVKMLVTPSRVGVAAKQVNLPNCVAVLRKGPPHVMVDSAIAHRIIRAHTPGRDPGRSTGTNGAMGKTERTKVRENDFLNKKWSSAVSLPSFAFFVNTLHRVVSRRPAWRVFWGK